MKNKNTNDMTNGKILPILLRFGLPVMLGSLFQHFYHLVDTSIAGYTIGDHAIAAISSTNALASLITATALGFSVGNAILISQAFGAKDSEKVRKSIKTMLQLSIMLSFGFTLIFFLLLDPILHLLNTPAGLMTDAKSYIRIIIAFSFTTVLFNMFSSIFRAVGNSKTPLLFLVLSSVINIVLDLLFMGTLHMGVSGAAWATVIAQGLSVLLCFIRFTHIFPEMPLLNNLLAIDKEIFFEMFPLGLSSALTNSLFSIGSIAVQGAVNSFGEEVIVAQAAAQKIENICIVPSSGIANSCATFVSQNHGAGKYERIKKAAVISMAFSAVCNIFTYTIIFFWSRPLIHLITNSQNEVITELGSYMLRIVIAFIVPQTATMVFRMSIQSMKYKILPLVGTFIELFSRGFSAFYLAPRIGFTGICLAEPLSWVLSGIVMFISFILIMRSETKLTSTHWFPVMPEHGRADQG